MLHAEYLSSSYLGFLKGDFLIFNYIQIRKINDSPGQGNFDPRAFI
jgi:hypothetical protein